MRLDCSLNAALERLKFATVPPGATPTLSTYSSASLCLCQFLDAFSCSLTHAAVNLQPSSRTVLYETPGSSTAVLQSPVMSNIRRSSDMYSINYFSFSPGPRLPAFSDFPGMTLLGNLWSPLRSTATDHTNLLMRTVASILSRPVRSRASL